MESPGTIVALEWSSLHDPNSNHRKSVEYWSVNNIEVELHGYHMYIPGDLLLNADMDVLNALKILAERNQEIGEIKYLAVSLTVDSHRLDPDDILDSICHIYNNSSLLNESPAMQDLKRQVLDLIDTLSQRVVGES